MEIVNSYQAKTHLAKLIRRALAGERIVIARAGRPLVELKPYERPRPRVADLWQGRVRIAEDFDAPLADFEHALYGDDVPA